MISDNVAPTTHICLYNDAASFSTLRSGNEVSSTAVIRRALGYDDSVDDKTLARDGANTAAADPIMIYIGEGNFDQDTGDTNVFGWFVEART